MSEVETFVREKKRITEGNMFVEMTQHAVGQGGFFFGSLRYSGKEFCYVYDCGANNKAPLNREIDRVLEERKYINVEESDSENGEKPIINVLFLSHYDFDHVRGLIYLLERFHIKRVVLPYLNPKDKTAALLKNAGWWRRDRGLASNIMEFILNAVEWLIARNVEDVIQIPRENDFPRLPPIPGGDDRGGDPSRSGDEGRRAGPIPPRHFFEESENLNPVWCYIDANSQWQKNLDLHSKTNRPTHMNTVLYLKVPGPIKYWALAPYVHPPCEHCFDDFLNEVKKEFGNIDDATIIRGMSNSNFRERIRGCYDKFFPKGSNHNLISMTLYTGPTNLKTLFFVYGDSLFTYTMSGGILLTGDADFSDDINQKNEKCARCKSGLSGGKRRDAFLKYYDTFKVFVGALMAPHHGSRKSFSLSLLKYFRRATVCYACAGKNSYGHPSIEVRCAVDCCTRSRFQVVSDHSFSELKCVNVDRMTK